MELGSVVQFLENKAILVSGSTGFLAKVFVEKILRVQPNVKKLYLLVRAADAESAKLRFHNEVLAKDVFNVLREKWGAGLNSYIAEKVTIVAGDISGEDFGVEDSDLKKKLQTELDVIVSSAANTKFDERYDVAFGINTLGAKNLVEFAKKCVNLKVLVHVSTAYVCGERTGLISERLPDGSSELQVDVEMKVIEEALNELKAKGASQNQVSAFMRDLGTKRANMHGRPNTYVFTKAMGEILMQQSKEYVSIATVRPTMVSSTYKDPFPGWAEDLRTINTLFAGPAQGKLPCLIGEKSTIVDVIPADMVVNAMFVAMVAHADRPSSSSRIYHVGSSLRNPVTLENLRDYSFDYFTKNPWIDKFGEPVKVNAVTLFSSVVSFHIYMQIRYLLPLKALQVVNKLFGKPFEGVYRDLNRKVKFTMTLVQLYKPYLYYKAVFDDTNTQKLRMAARQSAETESDLFCFDPASIDWREYFMNTHIPGLRTMMQPKRRFPATTKAPGNKHLHSEKTITAAVKPLSRLGITHFPVSHRNDLGINTGATCKPVLGVYAV